jgi:hypothetical protein
MRLPWTASGCALAAALLLTAGCADRAVKPLAESQRGNLADSVYCTPAGSRLSSGALYQVCAIPARWNGDIVVYVPGYHDPASTPELPGDFATSAISKVLLPLGYAYASTSFRGTGLIQPEWIDGDLLELVSTAKSLLTDMTGHAARYVYQAGGSQGGLATVQAVERHPEVFSGGLAACGPIGDYAKQIDYVGDFRVVFDEYFRDVIPGWPVWRQDATAGVPGTVDPASWSAAAAAVIPAIGDPGNASRMAQVLAVTGAPIDAADPSSIQATALGVLWYSFRGTNDAIAKAGGVPFDNSDRSYRGSSADSTLNSRVQRFHSTADPSRLAALQTQARLERPLVTMHTTGDPIVPIWHEQLYANRLSPGSRAFYTPITVERYGHCNFTDAEILAAFSTLVLKVSGAQLVVPQNALPDPAARAAFQALAARYGARPIAVPGAVAQPASARTPRSRPAPSATAAR